MATGKAKRFTEKYLKKNELLQKLENDANKAKKKKKWKDASELLEECVTGWKTILADVDSDKLKREDTNPDVKFEPDDFTKKLMHDYFGTNIK